MGDDWAETLEEVAALRAILGEDAFVAASPGLKSILDEVSEGAWDPSAHPVMLDALKFTIQVGMEKGGGALTLSVGPSYPNAPPQLSVACEWLRRQQVDAMLLELQALAKTSSKTQDRCLYALVEGMEELMEVHSANQRQETTALSQSQQQMAVCRAPELQIAVLRLDHMHNRTSYTKTITKWAQELGLTGRLVFCGGFIFVLLEGEAQGIDEYLLRKRTVVVDVDSRGRKCRERQMSILVRQPCSSQAFSEFETVENDAVGQVDSLFEKIGLGGLIRNIMQV